MNPESKDLSNRGSFLLFAHFVFEEKYEGGLPLALTLNCAYVESILFAFDEIRLNANCFQVSNSRTQSKMVVMLIDVRDRTILDKALAVAM